MEDVRDMPCGRMLLEHSAPTKATTSRQSSKPSSALKKKELRCLRLKKADGQKPTYYWETDGAWLTELSTASTGAFPKEEVVSTLSQILQVKVPAKYYLSPKACLGILRRASVRGKKLPIVLKQALERQAGQSV